MTRVGSPPREQCRRSERAGSAPTRNKFTEIARLLRFSYTRDLGLVSSRDGGWGCGTWGRVTLGKQMQTSVWRLICFWASSGSADPQGHCPSTTAGSSSPALSPFCFVLIALTCRLCHSTCKRRLKYQGLLSEVSRPITKRYRREQGKKEKSEGFLSSLFVISG